MGLPTPTERRHICSRARIARANVPDPTVTEVDGVLIPPGDDVTPTYDSSPA